MRPWIAAVGGAREIAGSGGPDTRVIDAEGGMVLPGFQDAHCHLAESGYQLTLCDLADCDSPEAYPDAIAAYAAAHPDRPVIAGGGWAMSDFPGGVGAREALDAVVSDRPVILYSRDYHGAWVNTRALEAAGITRDTADPRGGRIERDADGNPTGTLQEKAIALAAEIDSRAGRRRAGRRPAGGAALLPQPGHHGLPGRPGAPGTGRRPTSGWPQAAIWCCGCAPTSTGMRSATSRSWPN